MKNLLDKKQYIALIANKVLALTFIFILYHFVSIYQEYANRELPNSILYRPILINLCFGLLLGWFLCDNVALKGSKSFKVVTFIVLLLFSLGRLYLYSSAITNITFQFFQNASIGTLVMVLYKLSKYFQIMLGFFIFLLGHDTLKKVVESRCVEA